MEEFIACLRDAGCREELTAELCRLFAAGDKAALTVKLRRHRCTLLDALHESQRQVDCLDFLLQKLAKQQI